jgi:hypothetical protein
MALATGAITKSYGTTVNHVVNGASVASAAFSTAITNAFANTDGYLWADLILTLTKAAAGTGNLTVNIYKRSLDLVSASDAVVPSANMKSDYVGRVVVDNTTTEQFGLVENVWVGGRPCEFYIENLTGQSINATWDLTIMPFTFGPA